MFSLFEGMFWKEELASFVREITSRRRIPVNPLHRGWRASATQWCNDRLGLAGDEKGEGRRKRWVLGDSDRGANLGFCFVFLSPKSGAVCKTLVRCFGPVFGIPRIPVHVLRTRLMENLDG
jgi:hypothetical protein